MADPSSADQYERNAAALIAKLVELDKNYRSVLAGCRRREIVVNHNAFNYLGLRYGFIIHSLLGKSPDVESSPARLAELATLAKQKKLPAVFTEPLGSKAAIETLAREVGVDIRTLNPIEGLTEEEIKLGENYFSLMEKNLKELKAAMD